MKLTLPVDQLTAWTTTAYLALPARPPVPVLAGLLLDATEDGRLSVSGFDFEVSVRASGPVEVGEPGRVLLSGRLLGDIARTLPKGSHAELQLDGPRMVLTAGSARFTLPTLPIDEYPTLPQIPVRTATVAGELFAAAVAQVAVAAGRDDTLPVLTGVYLEVDLEQRQLTMAATDRYRFAVRRVPFTPAPGITLPVPKVNPVLPDEEPKPPRLPGFLIPARTLADIVKSLGDQDVDLALTEGMVAFATPALRTTTRLLEGEFPRWRALVPTEFATEVLVDRDALAEAVGRVATVAQSNTPIRLHVDSETQTIRVEAGSGDDAQAVDELPADIEGDTLGIAFNPAYLVAALRSVADSNIRLSLQSSTKPALVTGSDQDQDAPEHLHILMPVRLS